MLWLLKHQSKSRKTYTLNEKEPCVAGYFISKIMEIAGVKTWDELPGKTISIKIIGEEFHIIGQDFKDGNM